MVVFETVFVLRAITRGFNETMKKAAQNVQGLKRNVKDFNGVLSLNQETFKGVAQNMTFARSKGASLGIGFRKLTSGLDGFNMGLLGTIFFMQSISKAFLGFLQPALQTVGVFELWSNTLTLLFLPVAEMMIPFFTNLIDIVSNIPGPVKKAIGITVLVIGGLAAIFAVVAAAALGIGALISAGMVGTVAVITLVIAAIIAFAVTLIAKWKDLVMVLTEGMRFWVDVVKNSFNAVAKFVLFSVNKIKQIVTTAFNGVKDFVVNVFSKIKTFIMNVWDSITNRTKAVARFIPDTLKTGINKALNLVSSFKNTFVKNITGLWNSVRDIFGKISASISSAISKLNIFNRKNKTSGGGSSSFFSFPKFNDFIWRAGSGPARINPNDTVVGFKGQNGAANLAGGGSGVTVNQNLTITGSMTDEVKRIVNESNKRLVDDIRRLTGARGF